MLSFTCTIVLQGLLSATQRLEWIPTHRVPGDVPLSKALGDLDHNIREDLCYYIIFLACNELGSVYQQMNVPERSHARGGPTTVEEFVTQLEGAMQDVCSAIISM